MCGIAGAFFREPESSKQYSEVEISKTLAVMKSRGPDDSGYFTDKNAVMLHTRLSIIDPGDGKQPMRDKKGNVLVFNGEIYNYPELKLALAGKYDFQTQCDTEIILALYNIFGLDFIEHLRGMYAFALYDPEKKEMIVARDSYGIKPLYIYEDDRKVVFGSEIKAIQRLTSQCPELAFDHVRQVMKYNYIRDMNTPWSNIKRIKPGKALVFKSCTQVDDYDMTPLPCTVQMNLSESEALEIFDKNIRESVDKHCLSDVGYGLFLSGGLDSTTLAVCLNKQDSRHLNCYTASFDVTRVADESDIAKKTAKDMGFTHSHIQFTQEDFWTYLPKIAAYMDDPVADYAILPTWKLAEYASAEQKVVLSGEGGDEMLAGYGRYRSYWWKGLRRKFQLSFGREHRNKNSQCARWCKHWSRLQRHQARDFENWLPNDLLIKLDNCLMAHSLEGRTPFLDRDLAKALFTFPDHLKIRGKYGKYIQRKWLEKNYPNYPAFMKKQGFTVPVASWIEHERDRALREILSSRFMQQMMSASEKEALSNRSGIQLWPYLYLAFWSKNRTGI